MKSCLTRSVSKGQLVLIVFSIHLKECNEIWVSESINGGRCRNGDMFTERKSR